MLGRNDVSKPSMNKHQVKGQTALRADVLKVGSQLMPLAPSMPIFLCRFLFHFCFMDPEKKAKARWGPSLWGTASEKQIDLDLATGWCPQTWPPFGDVPVCGRLASSVVQTEPNGTLAVSSVYPRSKQEGSLDFNGSHIDLPLHLCPSRTHAHPYRQYSGCQDAGVPCLCGPGLVRAIKPLPLAFGALR